VRNQPDISALASQDKGKIAVLLWHYHDDDVPGPDAAVQLTLNGILTAKGKAKLTRYAIDADHSNSFAAWQKMGSPLKPTAEQLAQLEKAGRLASLGVPEIVPVTDGVVKLNLNCHGRRWSCSCWSWIKPLQFFTTRRLFNKIIG